MSKDASKVPVGSGICNSKDLNLVPSFDCLGCARSQVNQFVQELALKQRIFLEDYLRVSARANVEPKVLYKS